ncbi:MAG TPA: hypothetical protein PJ982_13440, partial [Lacipirellulaceae bacterium]|nr:hypothetical protein [Lacipirellulaceae bacterium]
AVANHFGVFAAPNPNYVPLPTPPRPGAATPDQVLTSLAVLDDFDDGLGRFSWTPYASSGSTFGITAASTAEHSVQDAQAGAGSQRITLTRDGTTSARFRHVSGGGNPLNNRVVIDDVPFALAPQGYVGFFLKTTEEDIQVAIGLDDGVIGGTGLEISASIPVIADGQWRLYEWNLADANQWANFSGGNGRIDGPNAYVDSIFFFSGASTAGQTFAMSLDTVAYNPHGSLASLIVAPPAADFDGDGDVDADDLEQWRGDFGTSGGSDANSDGVTDGADFLIWQRQLGSGLAAAHLRAVPEVAGAALISQAAVLLIRRTGRRGPRRR